MVARKRTWNRKDEFETTSENFKYMTPVKECSKEHAVLDSEGGSKVVSCVMKDLKNPEEREHEWEMVPRELEQPAVLRRRLRQKTSVSTLQLPEQTHRDRIQIFQALVEEEKAVMTDDPDVAPAATKGLMAMRLLQMAAQQREDEDEILQTRVVSNQEVFQQKELWTDAIKKEMKSLFDKGAVRKLSQEEVAYYKREHADKLEVVPGKAVHTVKHCQCAQLMTFHLFLSISFLVGVNFCQAIFRYGLHLCMQDVDLSREADVCPIFNLNFLL